MHSFLKVSFYIICCLIYFEGPAQSITFPEARNQSPSLRLIAPGDAFAKQAVTAVVQDDGGFMWITTNGGGLGRYDGKTIKLFKHRAGDSSSITSDAIWNIYKDQANRLWLEYYGGAFDLFDPVTEKVRHLSAELDFLQKAANALKVSKPESLVGTPVMFEDSKHRLWMRYLGLTACIDATGKGSIVFYAHLRNVEDGNFVINETPEGHILFIYDNDIKELDENTGTLRQIASLPKTTVAVKNASHYSLRRKDSLYFVSKQGITIYNMRTKGLSYKDIIPKTAIIGETAISTSTDYFLFYDTATTHLYRYTLGDDSYRDLGKYDYATSTDVDFVNYKTGYCYDKWGGLWHFHKNLFYSTTTPKPFTVVKKLTNPLQQITSFFYNPPTVADKWSLDATGVPWVQSPLGATYIIDSSRKLHLMAPANAAIEKISDGSKWVVMFTGSWLRSDNHYDEGGKIWVADNDKMELFTIDTAGNVRTCPQKFPSVFSISSMTSAGGENCWVIQSYTGLSLYNLKTGLVRKINTKPGLPPLPQTDLAEIVRDGINKNTLWITTLSSGIIKFDEKEETWQIYTEQDGWPSNYISSPIIDDKGFLWYQTTKGVYRYDTEKNQHVHVVTNADFKGNSWSNAYALVLTKNQLWFSNVEEAAIVNTDQVADVRNVTTVLTGIKINNKQMVDEDTSLVPAPINTLPALHFAYDQNFISFQFAALDYALPEQIRYRYQMVGIDKGWVDNGENNEAQYTSLPPGSYTFKVNATNEDGNWSKEIKSIQVIISPPWWRTWWMYAIYALLLSGAVYWFIKTRLRRLQLRQQVVLKQREAEQAQALEETKSRFFTNITHELRTPLTLILSPVQKQLQEGAATYSPALLQGVYHQSKILLRLINQLMDMSKLEGGSMPVTLSRGNIVVFVDDLLNTFRQQAIARSMDFTYQPNGFSASNKDQGGEEYLFDSDKLEKILYNLLSNAFKFTPDGGSIAVTVQKEETSDQTATVRMSVADSGIGIAPESLPHIFDRFYQVNSSTTRKYEGTGIGLSLVKELTELMGGEMKVTSTEGKGSVFIISLPLTIASEQHDAPLVEALPTAMPVLPVITETNTENTLGESKQPVVLVAEDNEGLRQFISECLTPHYKVITAVNGKEGLETATVELPELIISDVMMPVMDGYEFCQKIKANPVTSHIGFVMLTAKSADESRISGLRLGADHYLGKPFNVEELLLVASNLLKRQEKLREYYSKQLQLPTEKLPPVTEVEDEFLQSVYSIIETHLDSDQLDVDFLATKLAVSRRTLNRKLSAIANTSANEIIRNYRLKKAAGLLVSGHSVSEAAYATGFSTPSYFSQCFKEMYGSTPVQYAENSRLS